MTRPNQGSVLEVEVTRRRVTEKEAPADIGRTEVRIGIEMLEKIDIGDEAEVPVVGEIGSLTVITSPDTTGKSKYHRHKVTHTIGDDNQVIVIDHHLALQTHPLLHHPLRNQRRENKITERDLRVSLGHTK
jgi:hypothetical protein